MAISDPRGCEDTSSDEPGVAARLTGAKQPPSLAGWLALDRIRHRLFDVTDAPLVLGRYRLGARLGAGGCGTVFAAFDPALGRDVAIKVLHAPLARERLRAEARTLAALQHANIVTLFDFGDAAPTMRESVGEAPEPAAYVVMERIDGVDLEAWCEAHGRDEARVVALAVQAADALAAAHDVGVAHRDVKPANLLVDAGGRVHVVDFGMAGTPAYMAPEQQRAPRDAAVVDVLGDQFALGVTLYEAIEGQRPFVGEDADALARTKSTGTIPPPRRMSRALRRVLERMLAVDPAARFPDMRAVAAALTHATSRPPVVAALAGAAFAIAAATFATVSPPSRPPLALARALGELPLAERLATADAHEHAHRYDDSIAITSAAIAERSELAAPAELAKLLSRRGSARLRKGAIRDARDDLARAYFLAADAGDHATAARIALRRMVCESSYAGAPAEALAWARHAEAELARAEAMPDAEAALAYARGVALAELGLATTADAELQRAAGLYLALEPPDPRRAAIALVELGNDDLRAQKLGDAAAHFEAALALVAGDAGILERLASVRSRQERWAEARALYDRAFAARERTLGRDHVDVALVAYNRAVLESLAGDHDASEQWFDRAVVGWARALGPSSPQLALALDGRGTARQRLGRFADAVVDHEAAIAMLDRAVAPLDPRQRAVTSAHAGNALAMRGQWALAIVRAQQGLEALRASAVPDAATDASCRETLAGPKGREADSAARSHELGAARSLDTTSPQSEAAGGS